MQSLKTFIQRNPGVAILSLLINLAMVVGGSTYAIWRNFSTRSGAPPGRRSAESVHAASCGPRRTDSPRTESRRTESPLPATPQVTLLPDGKKHSMLLIKFSTPMVAPAAAPKTASSPDAGNDSDLLQVVAVHFARKGDEKKEPLFTVSPPFDFTPHWQTPRELLVLAEHRLPPGMSYRITFRKGLKDLRGRPVPAVSVTVHTAPFTIEKVMPPVWLDDDRIHLAIFFNGAISSENWKEFFRFDPVGPGRILGVQLVGLWAEKYSRFFSDAKHARFHLSVTPDIRAIRVRIRQGFPSKHGNQPLSRPWEKIISIPPDLVVGDLFAKVSNGRIHLEVSINGSLDCRSALHWFRLTPAVRDFTLKPSDSSGVYELWGDFQPKTTYRLDIRRGLSSHGHRSLTKDQVRTVITPEIPPGVAFLTRGPFCAGGGSSALALRVAQTNRIGLTVRRIYPRNWIQLLNDPSLIRWWYKFADISGLWATFQLSVVTPPNRPCRRRLPLAKILGSAPPGLYLFRVKAEKSKRKFDWDDYDSWWDAKDRALLVAWSKMAILGEQDSHGDFRAWVFDRAHHTPVAGARVRLISSKNQVLAEATTGRSGTASLRCAAKEDADEYVAMLTARRGNDITFLPLDTEYILQEPESTQEGGREYTLEPYDALLYADRDLCRPGASLRFSVQVRDRDRLEATGGFPARLSILDPAGRLFLSQYLEIDSFGFASTMAAIPRDARTGEYTACIGPPGNGAVSEKRTWGRFRFLVAAYTPERIRLHVSTDKPVYRREATIRVSAQADYYFGRPAAGCEATLQARFRAAAYQPPHHPGFSFDSPPSDAEIAPRLSFSGTTDEHGRVRFEIPLVRFAGSAYPVTVSLTVSLHSPGGRTITRSLQRTVTPAPFCLGLRRLPPAGPDAPDAVEFEWIAANPITGAPVKMPSPLAYKCFQVSWRPIYKLDSKKNYVRTWSEHRRRVSKGEVAHSQGFSRGRFRLPGAPRGLLELRLFARRTPNLGTRIRFSIESDDAPLRPTDALVLPVERDRARYRPGSHARLTFKARGPGSLLACIGTDRILATREQAVTPGENTVVVPIPDTPLGCVYATLYLLEGPAQRPGGIRLPSERYAVIPLRLDQSAHRLAVRLDAPDRAMPESVIDVGIHLKNAAGNPVPGRVQVFAVDEGVLAVTGYKTPNPFNHFFGDRLFGFDLYSGADHLFPDVSGLPGFSKVSRIGGDEARRAFHAFINPEIERAVALHLGVFEIPASGFRSVRVRIPHFSGMLRFMALAFTPEQVGSGERRIHVRDAITLQATGPKAVAPGDRFEISVHLFNNDLPACSPRLTAQVLSGPLVFDGPEADVLLKRKGDRVTALKFHARPDQVGAARIKIRAVPETGRSFTTVVVLAVRPPNPPLDAADLTSVPPGQERELRLPLHFYPGSIDLDFTASASLATSMLPALAWLQRYPYGCLEQTTSTAFPFLFFHPAGIRTAGDSGVPGRRFQYRITRAIHHIGQMQQYNGGFSMWVGGTETWPEASVYAALFLETARARGVPVDAALWRNTQSYLKSCILGSQNQLSPFLTATCHYILAHDQAKQERLLAGIFLTSNCAKTTAAQIMAGAGLILSGNAREGKRAVDKALRSPNWGRDRRGYLETPVTRMGLCALALEEVMPQSPGLPKIIAGLTKKQNQHKRWDTTIETAVAAAAILRWNALHPGQTKTSGAVRWGKQRTQFRKIDAAHPAALHFQRPAPTRFTVQSHGPGPIYCAWFARGVPIGPVRPSSRGLSIQRQYLDAQGRETHHFHQGDPVTVRITLKLENEAADKYLGLVNLLPGGFQIENVTIVKAARGRSNPNKSLLDVEYTEPLDDRFLVFGRVRRDLQDADPPVVQLDFKCRAVVRGVFTDPAVYAEAMYSPETHACTPGGRPVTIE